MTTPDIERPIFIVAPPRSGSTLLFETLARSPGVWTLDADSEAVVEGIRARAARRREQGDRLTAAEALPAVGEAVRGAYRAAFAELHARPAELGRGRLVERTPRNALRVQFLDAVFPEATFIYLYREPRETLAGMLAAWESGRFVTHPELRGWPGPPWSLLLIPRWRHLAGKELPEVVAEQWAATTRMLLDDLEQLAPGRWCVLDRDALVREPQREIERLCAFLGVEWRESLRSPLPLSERSIEADDPAAWNAHVAAIDPLLPRTGELAARARAWIASPGPTRS